MKRFGQIRIIDWQVLEQLGLDEVVHGFLSTIGRGWNQLFEILEDIYRVSTLEVFSTIEIDRRLTNFDRAGSIRFQLFGAQRTLS